MPGRTPTAMDGVGSARPARSRMGTQQHRPTRAHRHPISLKCHEFGLRQFRRERRIQVQPTEPMEKQPQINYKFLFARNGIIFRKIEIEINPLQ
ncbi:hypothetical protein [Variovorax sp. YR266]|uniref:hypothetical protein n=1 Tax=Variovorax sp. YR266 TaxID=1884386 RepID=UPI00115FA942|nr:hypothetical protein [Variovorax sp. YR266]